MMTSEWLEQHGFVCIKEYESGSNLVKTYQKVSSDEDILEVDLEVYNGNITAFKEDEAITNVELFCKNKQGLHDSISLNTVKDY